MEITTLIILFCIFGIGVVVGRITMAVQIAFMKDKAEKIRDKKNKR